MAKQILLLFGYAQEQLRAAKKIKSGVFWVGFCGFWSLELHFCKSYVQNTVRLLIDWQCNHYLDFGRGTILFSVKSAIMTQKKVIFVLS